MRKFYYLVFFLLPFFSFAEEEKNVFIPCRHSEEMLDLVLECIGKAEQSIELSLCFTGGSVFDEIFEKVEDRLKEIPELQVHALCSPVLLIDRDRDFIQRLVAKYPQQFHLQFTPHVLDPLPEVVTMDNHIKMIIVDEKYFSMGGTNFDEGFICEGTVTRPHLSSGSMARNNLPNGNRDQDIVGCGLLAQEMRKVFYKNYALWKHYDEHRDDFIVDPEYFKENNSYQPLNPLKKRATVEAFDKSPKKVQVQSAYLIISGPMDNPNKITLEYEKLLRLAKKEIQIGNLYFNPAGAILPILMEKVRKGLLCTVITNGLFEHSPGFHSAFVWANRINYPALFYGKEYNFWESRQAARDKALQARIYEYKVPGIMYHKKVMVIDRKWAIIGSYNLGLRSASTDYEAIVVMDSPEMAEKFIDILEEDKRFCEEVTPLQARTWYFDPMINYIAAFQKQFHGFF